MNLPTDADAPRPASLPRFGADHRTFAVGGTFMTVAAALVVGRLYANDRVESLRSFVQRKAEQFALALGQSLADCARLVALQATRPAIVEALRAQAVLTTMQATWPDSACGCARSAATGRSCLSPSSTARRKAPRYAAVRAATSWAGTNWPPPAPGCLARARP